MRWARPGSFYILRLDPGEDVARVLTEFVRERRLGSGVIAGIGAADEIELGLYDLKKRDYLRRTFQGDHEILSLAGNIAWAGEDPVCHLHCVISDDRMAARGGHLYRARVSVTCEITILPGTRKLSRLADKRTGLKLLALPFGSGRKRSS